MPHMFLVMAFIASTASTTWPQDAEPSRVESLERELSALESLIDLASPLPSDQLQRAESVRQEATYLRLKSRKHRERGGEGTGVTSAEVAELRLEIARLQEELETADIVELPAQTVFAARLLDPVSSETAAVGDRVEAVTVLPVTVRGTVLVPQGSSLFGAVEVVDRASRTDRTARLVLAFDRIDIDGRTHGITATVVGASQKLSTGLASEKKPLGIGAGVGSVVGAVLSGGTGALAGAILGGSGALFATGGKNVHLPEGTMLQLRLDRPARFALKPLSP